MGSLRPLGRVLDTNFIRVEVVCRVCRMNQVQVLNIDLSPYPLLRCLHCQSERLTVDFGTWREYRG